MLSVLFRVLPPGRTLLMSLSAVAREAAVIKSTVARAFKKLRAARILVAGPDGKPTIDYLAALNAAIRSVASRPAGERQRRLARLNEIAAALGASVNIEFIEGRLAEFNAGTAKRLPGRHIREQRPRRVQLATDGAQVAPDRLQLATDRVQVASASGARCPPELNSNGNLKKNLNGQRNGPPSDGPRGRIQAEYGGKPTLIARVLDLMQAERRNWYRSEIAQLLEAKPSEVSRALR